jgi:CheY-like chemotaxis protein
VLLVEDYVDQATTLEDLLRRAGCHVTSIRGCSRLPQREDETLEGLDLADKPVVVPLPTICGVLLDGELLHCKGVDLMPTFRHHELFVVAQSGSEDTNESLISAGASMAIAKTDVASALIGILPPTSCFPWLRRYTPANHDPVLKRFDATFRRQGCGFFGSG